MAQILKLSVIKVLLVLPAVLIKAALMKGNAFMAKLANTALIISQGVLRPAANAAILWGVRYIGQLTRIDGAATGALIVSVCLTPAEQKVIFSKKFNIHIQKSRKLLNSLQLFFINKNGDIYCCSFYLGQKAYKILGPLTLVKYL